MTGSLAPESAHAGPPWRHQVDIRIETRDQATVSFKLHTPISLICADYILNAPATAAFRLRLRRQHPQFSNAEHLRRILASSFMVMASQRPVRPSVMPLMTQATEWAKTQLMREIILTEPWLLVWPIHIDLSWDVST